MTYERPANHLHQVAGRNYIGYPVQAPANTLQSGRTEQSDRGQEQPKKIQQRRQFSFVFIYKAERNARHIINSYSIVFVKKKSRNGRSAGVRLPAPPQLNTVSVRTCRQREAAHTARKRPKPMTARNRRAHAAYKCQADRYSG